MEIVVVHKLPPHEAAARLRGLADTLGKYRVTVTWTSATAAQLAGPVTGAVQIHPGRVVLTGKLGLLARVFAAQIEGEVRAALTRALA